MEITPFTAPFLCFTVSLITFFFVQVTLGAAQYLVMPGHAAMYI